MLKVSPMKGIHRLGKKGNLSPRYIRPFWISERIGLISYRLELLDSMADVHDIFYVSILRKYLCDEEQQHIADISDLHIQLYLTTTEAPIRIPARDEKKLKSKVVPLVKVL